MTPINDKTHSIENDLVAKQIRQMQLAVDANRRRLDRIKKKGKKADEDIAKCFKEISSRIILLKEYDDISNLKTLVMLLKSEHNLKEQLDGQSKEDRHLWETLEDRSQCVTTKIQSLTSEIEAVTQQLEEARAQFKAQASSPDTNSRQLRSRKKSHK